MAPTETEQGPATGRVLAVIPARGGSKRLPRKNLLQVGGRPLVLHTVVTALAARDVLHRTVVSTDDAEIEAVCRVAGADVPFRRPHELATDDSPTLPVLRHAVSYVEREEGQEVSWVLTLQPTSPLRIASDIREAIRLAALGGCDSVVGVVEVRDSHPVFLKKIEEDRLVPFCVPEVEGTRRQDVRPPAYKRNGAIYLTRREVVMERGSIWGSTVRPYVMPPERSVDIDTELDLRIAELLLADLEGPLAPAGGR